MKRMLVYLPRLWPLLLAVLALGLIGAGARMVWGTGPALLAVGGLLWLDLFVGDAIETWRKK